MRRFVSAIYVAIVICLCPLSVWAQTRSGETTAGTGSVTGRITSGGKPLTGLNIVLQPAQLNGPTAIKQFTLRSKTDADGRYQFTGIPAGNYQIAYLSPLYLQAGDSRSAGGGRHVMLKDGENAAGVNIELIRGGVITGKITDPDGRPLIEQEVRLDRFDAKNKAVPVAGAPIESDDRGIYRVIGIAPGRYRISAGVSEELRMRSLNRRAYPLTFHPDTRDVELATIIEVREGSVIDGIDIKLGTPPKVFSISGRVVDADAREPIPNIAIHYNVITSTYENPRLRGSIVTNATGIFHLENVRNGHYELYVASGSGLRTGAPFYSDKVPVEVMDESVSGIEIRVKRGGSISGVVVIEGTPDSAALARFAQRPIIAFPEMAQAQVGRVLQTSMIRPDGHFRLDGLLPGKVTLVHTALPGNDEIRLIKVERDGIELPGGIIEIEPGGQVTGVRIVYGYGNCVVRGQVVVIGGALPEGVVFVVGLRRAAAPNQSYASNPTRTDARGNFVLEGVVPGQYEIEARISFMGPPPPEWGRRPLSVKQTIEVINGQPTQVTMTLDLSQEITDRER